MARPKKATLEPKDIVHYHATTDPYLHTEIYIADSQEQAIADLREDEGDVDTIYLFEVRWVGKYKVKFTLDKID